MARILSTPLQIVILLLTLLDFINTENPSENVCEPLVAPYKGEASGNCNGSSAADVCTVRCREPFKLSGPAVKSCNGSSGSWSPANIHMCIDRSRRCRRIQPPAFGYFVGKCQDYVGAMCSMQCIPGYEIIGTHARYCTESGSWEPQQPRCQRKRCPLLKSPIHGKIVGSCDNNLRSTCVLACDEGYILVGSKARKCTHIGSWDGDTTKCVKSCPILSPLRNGLYLGDCWRGIHPKVCHVRCQRGYESDHRSIECKNGSWSSIPKCKPIQCKFLRPPDHGSYSGYCSPGLSGRPCLFSCDDDFDLVGRRSIYCKRDGNWSSPAPICRPSTVNETEKRCPDIEPHHIYDLKGKCQGAEKGDTCNVTCFKPNTHDVVDEAAITCLEDGQWSSANLACDSRMICCPAPRKPKRGRFLNCDPGEKHSVGKICEQVCDEGFKPVSGTTMQVCMPTGEWEGTPLVCRRRNKPQDRQSVLLWKAERKLTRYQPIINGSLPKGYHRNRRNEPFSKEKKILIKL